MADQSALPPLIDREIFFGDPEIAGAKLSRDGRYLAFLKPHRGTRNIWVKPATAPFDSARPITADTKRPISSFFWSRDSRYVLYVQDVAGDENINVYAVDPAGPAQAETGVPAARNLTQVTGARAMIYDVPKARPDVLYVGLNDRDPAWHDLYEVNIATGARTLLRRNDNRITGWLFDLGGRLRLAERAAPSGDTELLRIDGDEFKAIYRCSVLETCRAVQFHNDGRRIYLITNHGADVDLISLVLLDLDTGAEQRVDRDPHNRVDLSDLMFSAATDELIAAVFYDDKPRYSWHDAVSQADFVWLEQRFPLRQIEVTSATADASVWLITTTADVEPGEVFIFDRAAKQLRLQYRVRENLQREHLARMEPIRYRSVDGLEIPGYLTLPKGLPPRSLPLIVHPHGGPWARDLWGINNVVQFLANRGFAVLQPNFRGSTGYGKAFLDAGNRQWGDLMQDDITAGVKHLIAEGIADPKRVAIMGGSYGGYATLAAVAFTPDDYAAAVSVVGPSNLITLQNSIPPYWEASRAVFRQRMGDLDTPQGRAQLERQSPLNSADRIKTPLLVVQGAHDPRVKKAESDQIVTALQRRGFPVEYLVAQDEGHGFAHPLNNLALFAAAEQFLAKFVGTRHQEQMSDAVAQRLATLRAQGVPDAPVNAA